MVLVTTTSVMQDFATFYRSPGEHCVRCACVNRTRAIFLQSARRLHQSACGINQVVDDQAGAAVDITDYVHDLGNVHVHTALIYDGQRSVHLLSEEAGRLYTAGIG